MSDKTKEISRRTIMSGAAALPAVAVLPTIADAAANPDAELLNLGRQLDEVLSEVTAHRAINAERMAAFDAKVERVTGIARRDVGNYADRGDDPIKIAYWEAYEALPMDGCQDDDDNPWDRIHGRLYSAR
jgi:hypothetical protein